MNVELVNTILNALYNVTKMMLNADIKIKDKFTKDSVYASEGIASIVGFVGTNKGQVIFISNAEMATKITSKMMGGYVSETMDDIIKSGFGEFSNMVLGNSAIELSSRGKIIDITPPTIVIGNKIELSIKNTKPFCLIIEIDGLGELELDIICNN